MTWVMLWCQWEGGTKLCYRASNAAVWNLTARRVSAPALKKNPPKMAEVPKQYQIDRVYRTCNAMKPLSFTSLIAHQNLLPKSKHENLGYLNTWAIDAIGAIGNSLQSQVFSSIACPLARKRLDNVGCLCGLCSSTKEALRSTRPCKTSTSKRKAKVEISFTSIYNCSHCICYEASFADNCGCPAGTTMKSLGSPLSPPS